jgi:hypothetical protein
MFRTVGVFQGGGFEDWISSTSESSDDQFKNIIGYIVPGTVRGKKILLLSGNWMRIMNCDSGGSGVDG